MSEGGIILPGEVICPSEGFMAGHGAYEEKGKIVASIAGLVQKADKLVFVKPLKSRYKPEVGDVVVGRIISVESKRWTVDINAALFAGLQLTAINLPGGEQRRRSEEDKLKMREFYGENELLSGEVQSINSFDNTASLHTRNLKYGKLMNGMLIEVQPHLIRRMKHHFVTYDGPVRLIIGTNGYIWVYYSTTELREETYVGRELTEEQKVQHETREIPSESRDLMARIRNAICALQAKGWPIFIDTIRSVVTDSINHKIPTALMTRPESLSLYQAKLSTLLEKDQAVAMEDIGNIFSISGK